MSIKNLNNPYILYTDGSCYNGSGGWGWILKEDLSNLMITQSCNSAGVRNTTISRMEMSAVIDGLANYIGKGYKNPLFIISDSQFVVNSINQGWMKKWKEFGFVGRPNKDLWKIFDELLSMVEFDLKFVHTRGHGRGMERHIQGNKEVDKLCSYKNFQRNSQKSLQIKI